MIESKHCPLDKISRPIRIPSEDHVPDLASVPDIATPWKRSSTYPGLPSISRRISPRQRHPATHLARRSPATANRSLDTLSSQLADAGRLDLLTQYDHLRAKIDRLIARIRGAWQGYSGIFDLVRVDEGRLDRVYDHDVSLMQLVEEFLESIKRLSGLPASGPSQTTAAAPAMAAGSLTPAQIGSTARGRGGAAGSCGPAPAAQ